MPITLPCRAAHRLADARARLNAKAAAFAASATDVDADGRVFRLVAIVLLAMALLRAAYVHACGLPVFETDVEKTYLLGAALLPLLVAATRWRLAEATLVLRAGLVMATCAPLFQTFCVDVFYTGRAFPLADGGFERLDRALGFDWLACARFLDSHSLLWDLTVWAYRSILVQFGAVVAVLAFSRAASRLYAYLVAQTLALTLVALIALLLPAIGAYEQSGAAHVHFAHAFDTGDGMTASILWLRAGASGPGGVDVMTLISFPSFHACCAVLFAWAMWHVPWLRWVGLALNLAMALGTPVHGSHYLVDVLAGVAIAAVAILVSTAFVTAVRDRPRRAYGLGAGDRIVPTRLAAWAPIVCRQPALSISPPPPPAP